MVFPLSLTLRSSRGVLASVFATHGAAGLALFHATRSPWLLASGFGLIFFSTLAGWRGELRKQGVVLALQADCGVSVKRGNSAPVFARLRPDAVVFSWSAWFALEMPEAERAGRAQLRLMLVRTNLHPDQWRSLQVWLRHRALGAPEPSA
ncbi:MAG: hypothetical protein C0607_05795 [Azoarcus sp.]|nr:MAG: hypothetical protein C0607_05795 [Azoarcus sp.]